MAKDFRKLVQIATVHHVPKHILETRFKPAPLAFRTLPRWKMRSTTVTSSALSRSTQM